MHRLSAIPTRAQRDVCSSRERGLRATAPRVTVDLSPQAVERIAARVAQLLGDRGPQKESELISAGELARRLRVERPWVYRHCDLLGGLRIGAGPKAPWRFDYQKASAALQRHQAAQRVSGGR